MNVSFVLLGSIAIGLVGSGMYLAGASVQRRQAKLTLVGFALAGLGIMLYVATYASVL